MEKKSFLGNKLYIRFYLLGLCQGYKKFYEKKKIKCEHGIERKENVRLCLLVYFASIFLYTKSLKTPI
jgi:hypothetical protein